MRVAVFTTKKYDKVFLDDANNAGHELVYHEVPLMPATAPLATGYPAVCAFVNDQLSQEALIDMEQALRRCSALRRAAQQLYKSRRRLLEGGVPWPLARRIGTAKSLSHSRIRVAQGK